MSNSNITVGSVFKGKSKGKITFRGKNVVEAANRQTADVGGIFDGEQEEKSEIDFNETNEVK